MSGSSKFYDFITHQENIFSFVIDNNYDILECNKGLKGNIKEILNKEDQYKLEKYLSKKLKNSIYLFIESEKSEIKKPYLFNVWIEEDFIYFLGTACSPESYYQDANQSISQSLHSVTLNTEGIVIESDTSQYPINHPYKSNCPENIYQKFKSAFEFCVKHKTITGFEYTLDTTLSNSILYRFIPKEVNEQIQVSLIIQKLDFNNYGEYSENYFQEMIDNSADFIYKSDVQGYFIYVNDHAKKKYDFNDSSNTKTHYTDWIRPDYKDIVNKFYTNQIEQKIETTYLEFPTVAKNGEELWIGQNVCMVFSGDWILGVQTTARDITENKIIENELMDIQSKNQAILDTIPNSMFLIGKDFELLDKKIEASSYFFNINVNDYIYNTNLEKNNLETVSEKITICLEEQKSVAFEIKSAINGTKQIYDIRIAPVDDSQVLFLVGNITEIKQQHRKLQILQDKERAALDAKQRYLSFMTHEIRTPLNTIIGLNDLMFDTNPTPKQVDYLKSIQSSSSILSKIINDVLDFNKLENNSISLDISSFNLYNTIKEVVKICSIYRFSKPVQLEYNIDPQIPNILKGDGSKLTQVLTNLVSNALKFTEKGSVTISAELVNKTDIHARIKFAITDTGIGIPEDKIDKVFNSYEQVNTSANRKYGGTGLGLTISQQFIKLMGGEITIQSQLNNGSSFHFEIGLELSEDKIEKEKTPTKVDLSSFHILLVEDNQMNQLVMSKYFNKWGLSYDIAENGIEALEKIENNEYHLTFLDLEMPIMDGFETAERIRNHQNKDINQMVIIALSASVFSEVEERTKAIGFNDFIGKPINANYVYLKLTEYLLGENAHYLSSNENTSINSSDQSYDLSYLLESSLNDANYVRKMIELFLTKTPEYISELFELLEKNDLTALKKLVHKYKASVAIMGIRDAEKAIHQIESNISENQNLKDCRKLLEIVKSSSLKACEEIEAKLKTNSLF